ncbi:MAG: BatA domain-containing protein [Planctomycetes bacterium]|nr:BatA domain-containing protein [Planctomycetota bacterium]
MIHPYMLWGLLAATVPVIVHLLSRFRYRTVHWGAMELLKKALEVRGRQVNLEDYILLLLRMLALILLALAFTRPTMKSLGAGGGGSRGVVILLDGSYSMSHRAGVDDRFGVGKQVVREILKTIQPGDPLTLALMGKGIEGSRQRVLYRNMQYDPERISRILAELEPLPEAVELESCLSDGMKLIKDMGSIQKECFIISDMQTSNWGTISQNAHNLLQEIGEKSTLSIIPIPSGAHDNVVISRLWLHSGMLRKGGIARYAVDVRNNGENPQERISVSLTVGDEIVDERVIPKLDAGQSKTVFLFARFEKAGATTVVAKLGPDALGLDNTRYAVAYVRDKIRVLCVDGDPSKDNYKSETYFLAKALVPKKDNNREAPVFVKVLDWHELVGENLSEYDILILANVADIPEGMVNNIYNFVQGGGGLLTMLGDKVVPEIFNQRMKYADQFFMPGELEEAVGDAESQKEFKQMEIADTDHPIARPLGLLGSQILSDCLFFRYFKIKPMPDSRVVLSLENNAAPLLLERRLGQGRIILYNSTADRAWTNFPIKPVSPILIHRMITYMTGKDYEQPYMVGEPMKVTSASAATAAKAVFADPSGEQTVVALGADRSATLEYPPFPGFYRIGFAQDDAGVDALASGEGVQRSIMVAANIDSSESDVRSVDFDKVSKSVEGLPLAVLARDQDLAGAIVERRVGRELWWPLMLLAIIALIVELFLARVFANRMKGVTSPVGSAHLGGRESVVTMPAEGGASR